MLFWHMNLTTRHEHQEVWARVPSIFLPFCHYLPFLRFYFQSNMVLDIKPVLPVQTRTLNASEQIITRCRQELSKLRTDAAQTSGMQQAVASSTTGTRKRPAPS